MDEVGWCVWGDVVVIVVGGVCDWKDCFVY